MVVRRERVFKTAVALLVLATAAAQAIRPERTNPRVDETRSIEHALPVPADVHAILDRGCADCHSSRTEWPWYSNVAPVSWFVIDHVNHGRRHLNLSDWARFSHEEATHTLEHICQEVSSGEMPLRSYLLVHRHAELSEADVRVLCSWTDTMRAQLAGRAVDPSSPAIRPPK
jgi:hypothetical protein